jgi:hypothetical protein
MAFEKQESGRGIMRGWIFRRAVALREFGERNNISLCIRCGVALREWIVNYSKNHRRTGGNHG